MNLKILAFHLEKSEVKLITQELLEFLFKRFPLAFIGYKEDISSWQRYFDEGIFSNLQELMLKWNNKDLILVSNYPSLEGVQTISFLNEEQLKEELLNMYPRQKWITQGNFKCTKCGECCRPLVKVNENDIKRIEKAGYKRDEFLDYDPLEINPRRKDILKQKNNVCMFLKRKDEIFVCTIYDHRPKNCRIYPFHKKKEIEDCVPLYLRKPKPLRDTFPQRT